MFRRHAIVSVLAVPALIALAGCEDDEKFTPQAIFAGDITGSPVTCGDSRQLFEVGSFGNLAENPPRASQSIQDGDAFGQGGVSIACSVISSGTDEFTVNATVALSGARGGLFKVDGKFKTSGEQTDIHAIFTSRESGNTYEQLDRKCTVRYPNANAGVAAGRVWGAITCANAENTAADRTCTVNAEFRFENCAQ